MRWPRFLVVLRSPDFVIGHPDNPYLLRWWVFPRNKRFNIYLHKFLRSDDDRALHDHPWVWCSLIIHGSYIEVMQDGSRNRRCAFRPVFRLPTTAHRVELIDDKPVWTLFFRGPDVREWGFICPQGWRHWKEFAARREGGTQIGRGCE